MAVPTPSSSRSEGSSPALHPSPSPPLHPSSSPPLQHNPPLTPIQQNVSPFSGQQQGLYACPVYSMQPALLPSGRINLSGSFPPLYKIGGGAGGILHPLSTPVMHPNLVSTLKSLISPSSPTSSVEQYGSVAGSSGGGEAWMDLPRGSYAGVRRTEEKCKRKHEALLASSPLASHYRDTEETEAAVVSVDLIQNRRPFKCNYADCDKTFKNPQTMRMHHKTHDSDDSSYRLGMGAKVPSKLKAGHNKKIPCGCPVCFRTFVGLYELRRHFGRKHNKGEKSFGCRKCDKKFYIEVDLRDHEKLCGEPIECKCGMKFAFKCNMVAHKKAHPACQDTSSSEEEQQSCNTTITTTLQRQQERPLRARSCNTATSTPALSQQGTVRLKGCNVATSPQQQQHQPRSVRARVYASEGRVAGDAVTTSPAVDPILGSTHFPSMSSSSSSPTPLTMPKPWTPVSPSQHFPAQQEFSCGLSREFPAVLGQGFSAAQEFSAVSQNFPGLSQDFPGLVSPRGFSCGMSQGFSTLTDDFSVASQDFSSVSRDFSGLSHNFSGARHSFSGMSQISEDFSGLSGETIMSGFTCGASSRVPLSGFM